MRAARTANFRVDRIKPPFRGETKTARDTAFGFPGWLPRIGGWLGPLLRQDELVVLRHLQPVLLPRVQDEDLALPLQELRARHALPLDRRRGGVRAVLI